MRYREKRIKKYIQKLIGSVVVSRKHFDAVVECSNRMKKEEIKRVNDKITEEKKALREILQKLSRIDFYYDGTYRVVYEFDPQIISEALMRGNDSPMVKYIADTVARQVSDALYACNIMRPEPHTFRRG